MEISAINSVLSSEINLPDASSISLEKIEPNFSNMVIDSLEKTNDSLNMTDTLIQNVALGDKVATHEIMIAMEQAKLELQMAIEVRNKLLDVYQEVMRMQI